MEVLSTLSDSLLWFLQFVLPTYSTIPIWIKESTCSAFVSRWVNASGQSVVPLACAEEASSPCTMSVGACSASYLRWWLLKALLFLAAVLPTSGDCPKLCVCNVPTEMHCTFRYLTTIPDPIQPAVKRINLGWALAFFVAFNRLFSECTTVWETSHFGTDGYCIRCIFRV